jgi:hypothetical protein
MSGPEPLEERTPSTWKLEVSWLFSIFGGHFLPLLDSSSRPKSMRNRIHSTGFFASSCMQFSVADPGFGIQCLFDPWIRDPGTGIGFFRIPDLWSRIPNPYFESLVTFFWVKSSIIRRKLAQIFFFIISKIKYGKFQFCEICGYKKGITQIFFHPSLL